MDIDIDQFVISWLFSWLPSISARGKVVLQLLDPRLQLVEFIDLRHQLSCLDAALFL